MYASGARLPLQTASLGAIVAIGVGESEDWESTIAGYIAAVADEGLVVLVDRSSPPAELSRRALCGGLSRVEQRQAGRTIVTSGRVMRL